MSDAPNKTPEEDILDEPLDPVRSGISVSPPNRTQENAVDPALSSTEDDETEPETRKSGPVFGYLAILFAAAFFMLLLAYFMQQRNNDAVLDGLRDSINQFQTLDELRAENESLREENEALMVQLKDAQEELESTTEDRDAAVIRYQEYAEIINVLSILYEAELKVAGEDYTGAATILASRSNEYLSDWIRFAENANLFSLQSRYDTLVSTLIELGALDEDWLA